jgi:hypothetical protein
MWRLALAISTQQPDSPFGRTYTALDRALSDQICSLITKLQQLGSVRENVDGRSVGELVFNNMNMMFIEFVKSDETSMMELRRTIRRQNRVLIQAVAGASIG